MVIIIAFLTMLIDHIGMIFFPYNEYFRIIGRISFPLFAWGIVRGFKLTKNKNNYIKRIFILAVISQIPLFFFIENFYNVCFTLLFGLLSLLIIEEKNLKIYFKFFFISLLLFISNYFNFDYSIYGILTIILLYFTWDKKISIIYFFLLTILFYNIDFNNLKIVYNIQIYAIFALIILYLTPIRKYDFKLNFYFKYGFYPVHLSVLYLIHFLIK
ncbi:hypothetical protein H3C61_03940 [Candidatus Gracilibacteria bacterium]|nr:hypothetical protein [Candidatus Gracilibacteria bacterium]